MLHNPSSAPDRPSSVTVGKRQATASNGGGWGRRSTISSHLNPSPSLCSFPLFHRQACSLGSRDTTYSSTLAASDAKRSGKVRPSRPGSRNHVWGRAKKAGGKGNGGGRGEGSSRIEYGYGDGERNGGECSRGTVRVRRFGCLLHVRCRGVESSRVESSASPPIQLAPAVLKLCWLLCTCTVVPCLVLAFEHGAACPIW